MAATHDGRRAALKTLAAFALLAASAMAATAHPLPDTVILLYRDGDALKLSIALPMHELQLALPSGLPQDAAELLSHHEDALRSYFAEHVAIESKTGQRQHLDITSFALFSAESEHTGPYEELRIAAQAAVGGDFDFADFLLRYDAIIHQVPNHSALVRTSNGGAWTDLGLLTYDLVTKRVPPMPIEIGD